MMKMGKKLVAARDLPAGHVLREEDIAAKSPGDGLPPYELDRLLGRHAPPPGDRGRAADLRDPARTAPDAVAGRGRLTRPLAGTVAVVTGALGTSDRSG